MIAFENVKAWIQENYTSDDVNLDYLTVSEPSTKARSWLEVANVKCGDRSVETVIHETWRHIESLIESCAESGKNEAAVRLNLYRSKSNAGSRVWRQSVTPNGDDIDGSTSIASGDVMQRVISAMERQNTELKQLVHGLVSTLSAQSKMGYDIAAKALDAAKEAQSDANDYKVLLAAKESESSDPMSDVMKMGAEALISLVKTKAELDFRANATKQIEQKDNE